MRNPYRSYLVRASAGSGKTYQLSQRFLQLVATHADPGSILTVTFTNKAASEMRERIIAEAARLCRDDDPDFANESLAFWEAAKRPGPRPLSPRQVGETILEQTQSLSVTTIDALFYEWAQYVAGYKAAELIDPLLQAKLERDAFEGLCLLLTRQGGLPAELSALSVDALRTRLGEIRRHDSSLWLSRHLLGEEAFAPWTVPAAEPPHPLELCAAELGTILSQVTNRERREGIQTALATGSLSDCIEAGLMTKTLQVSGSLIRGKKREALASEIAAVDQALLAYANYHRKMALNAAGRMQIQMGQAYDEIYQRLKRGRSVLDFGDLARAAFHLMHDERYAGSRYAVVRQIRHLMIDEFQDTSRLQWEIFRPLVVELTSGEGIHQDRLPTVFFVGDEKQSIYGFREADPMVMAGCATDLADRLEVVSMAESYRTAPVVLDFVNAAFASGQIADFPPHSTARRGDDWFVLNRGQVGILPLAQGSQDQCPAEQEARQIATLVAKLLAEETPVFDRATRTMRRLTPRDIGILYRAGTNSSLYEEALHTDHIPVMREEERGFFARPEINELLQLGTWLAAPDDTTALLSVLSGPLFNMDARALFTMLAQSPRTTEQAILDGLGDHPGKATLTSLAALARSATPPHVVMGEAISRLGAQEKFSATYGDSEAERRLIAGNLGRFLELILAMESEGKSSWLTCMHTLLARAQIDDLGNAGVSSDAVNLMTIHKAKGLEFPVVILADTGRPFGSKDRYWLRLAGEDRSRLFHLGVKADQPAEDEECQRVAEAFETAVKAECERLLYVALTRAQHYLWITGHETANAQGFVSTCFHARLAAALEGCGGTTRDLAGTSALLVEATASAAWQDETTDHAPQLPPAVAPPSVAATKVEPMTGSTAKTIFAEGDFTLHPPPLDMAPDAYGNLVHAGIEAELRGEPLADLPPPAAEEVERTLKALHPLMQGADMVLPEHPCVLPRGENLLTGVIDLVIVHPDRVHIIDFKTSRLAKATPGRLRAFAEARGYDRQIALYTKALREAFPDREQTGALYYTACDAWVEI